VGGTKSATDERVCVRRSIRLMLHDFQNYAFRFFLAPDQSFKSQSSDKNVRSVSRRVSCPVYSVD
jgi:hypothetical protein